VEGGKREGRYLCCAGADLDDASGDQGGGFGGYGCGAVAAVIVRTFSIR